MLSRTNLGAISVSLSLMATITTKSGKSPVPLARVVSLDSVTPIFTDTFLSGDLELRVPLQFKNGDVYSNIFVALEIPRVLHLRRQNRDTPMLRIGISPRSSRASPVYLVFCTIHISSASSMKPSTLQCRRCNCIGTIFFIYHPLERRFDVLPFAIQTLKAKGYKFVTISECLGIEAYKSSVPPSTRDVRLSLYQDLSTYSSSPDYRTAGSADGGGKFLLNRKVQSFLGILFLVLLFVA